MATPRSMDCPSCGAPLQIQEGQSIVICKFCRDTIRLDTPAAPTTPPPPRVEVAAPVRIPVSKPAARRGGAGLAGCGCSTLFTVGMLLFVGGILFVSGAIPLPAALRSSIQQVVPLNLTVFEGVALAPAASDTLPELIAFAQENSGGNLLRMMVKISAEGQLAWKAQPFTEESAYVFPNHILPAKGAVYVALKDTLYAYQLSDGASLWQAALADEAHPSCIGCLQAVEGHVVVLTGDGTVQAFEAATGDAAWAYTLQDTTFDMHAFGGQPAVIDREDSEGVLLFFDPATGAVARRLQPACTHSSGSFDETLSTYDTTLLYDEVSTALYVVFGTSEGCVQRWDLSAESDQPDWEAHLTYEDGYSSTSDQTLSLEGEALYLSAGNGFVRGFEAQTGDVRLAFQEEDVEVTVLGAQDGVVLLRATSTRGTRKDALWGLSVETGEVLWRYALDDAEPLVRVGESSGAVFDDTVKWTWRLMSGQVQVVRVHGKPQQLSLQSLTLKDGAQGQITTIPLTRLDTSSYLASYVDWRGARLWLWIDYHLYRLNTEAGALDFVWP